MKSMYGRKASKFNFTDQNIVFLYLLFENLDHSQPCILTLISALYKSHQFPYFQFSILSVLSKVSKLSPFVFTPLPWLLNPFILTPLPPP